MAKLKDLDEYFDPGLELSGIPPLLDKEYRLPLPSGELGLWCRRIAQTAGEVTAASSDEELQETAERAHTRASDLPQLPGDLSFEERLLGPALAAMLADSVPDPYIQFCAQVAYIWIVGGADAAERYWVCGGRPERLARGNRAERRANGQKTNTGAASATPSQGSTNGTSSRPKSRRRGGAARSRGSNS